MISSHGLDVRNLTVRYGRAPFAAVDDFTTRVDPGRTLSIVGPSGAGKSTVLRALCGLLPVSSGDVRIGGRSVIDQPPQRRRTAMVFASDALVRTMRIRDNLRLAVREGDAAERIADLTRALDIDAHLEKFPSQLSTGERQRVSIARAVLSDPHVLLLDEPLAPLDPDLRVRVRDEIVHVRERFAGPIVFVTHDHADAMAVADDLLVLIDGRIEDYGEPQRVYDRPATLRAARFLGTRPMNLVPADAMRMTGGGLAGFRAERARLTEEDSPLRGRVARVERTGADVYVHLDTPFGNVVVRTESTMAPHLGAERSIAIAPDDVCRYDATA